MAFSAPPDAAAAFAHRILARGELDAKLRPPEGADVDLWPEAGASPPARPARAPGLEMAEGAPPLPRPRELRDPEARARCLARFAHHELMAVELFAWALLRWPDAPGALRRGWQAVLRDEQRHALLYLERLRAHGRRLEDDAPHSGYFWKQIPALEASPRGPRAFLAAMGLTLEQANLDFSGLYRDAFREAGDEATARVCQRVHDDEIAHVRAAATWLARLDAEAGARTPRPLAEAYADCVPFPLSAARAKGRRFDVGARRRAGLDEEFIEAVRGARPRS